MARDFRAIAVASIANPSLPAVVKTSDIVFT